MEIVTGENGTKYGLALGPLIIGKLRQLYQTQMPVSVQNKLKIHMKENEYETLKDIPEEEFEELLTDDEQEAIQFELLMRVPNMLLISLRSLDGKRMNENQVTEYLEETVISKEDLHALKQRIADAIDAFDDGLDEKGESSTPSDQRAEGVKA